MMTGSGAYEAQELVTTAIKLESDSEANYRALAEAVSDAAVRSVFEKLAAQEAGHARYLEQIQQSFRKARGWPPAVAIPTELLATLEENMFQQVKDVDPQSFASQEQALRAAIQMEVDAIALYKGLSAMAADQSARNMFNTLVDWEEEHLFILNYWLGLLNR
jgi:rubrerythrin